MPLDPDDPNAFGLGTAAPSSAPVPPMQDEHNPAVFGLSVAPAQKGQLAPPQGNIVGPSGNTWLDLARSIGTGLVNAGIGLVSPAADLPNAIGVPGSPGASSGGPTPSAQQMQANAFSRLGMPQYQPGTIGGRVGQAAVTAAPLALTDPASIIPAMGGGAISQLAAEAFGDNPFVRALGFLVGGNATRAAGNLAAKPLGGFKPSGEVSPPLPAPAPWQPPNPPPQFPPSGTPELAKVALDKGVILYPGQLANSLFGRFLYSQGKSFPGSGSASADERQQASFNRAALKEGGVDAMKATPEVLQAGEDNFGRVVNPIANRTQMQGNSPTFQAALANIQSNGKLALTAEEWAPVQQQINNILSKMDPTTGEISGNQYLTLTQRGSPLADAIARGGSTGRYASQVRGALDDLFDQSTTPGDMQAVQQARAQYKVIKAIELTQKRSDTVGGPQPSVGDISPAALRSAVNQVYGDGIVKAPLGQVGINDLAKIGQAFLKEPGDSRTATRESVNRFLEIGGAAGLGLLGGAGAEGLPHAGVAAGGLAATAMANRIAQAIMRSQPIARQMVTRAISPSPMVQNFPLLPQVVTPFAGLPAVPGASSQ